MPDRLAPSEGLTLSMPRRDRCVSDGLATCLATRSPACRWSSQVGHRVTAPSFVGADAGQRLRRLMPRCSCDRAEPASSSRALASSARRLLSSCLRARLAVTAAVLCCCTAGRPSLVMIYALRVGSGALVAVALVLLELPWTSGCSSAWLLGCNTRLG